MEDYLAFGEHLNVLENGGGGDVATSSCAFIMSQHRGSDSQKATVPYALTYMPSIPWDMSKHLIFEAEAFDADLISLFLTKCTDSPHPALTKNRFGPHHTWEEMIELPEEKDKGSGSVGMHEK